MPRTAEVAADREDSPNDLVTANEVARSIYIVRPPSIEALKVIHVLMKSAGGRIADDVEHTVRLAEVGRLTGMRKHSRMSLKPLLDELIATVVSFDNHDEKRCIASGLLAYHETDYRDEESGNILISWRFGRAFRQIAALSCHWTILDKQTILALRSRYALMLFQHVSSFADLDRITSRTYEIDQCRAVLGVVNGRHTRFAELNRWALTPAVTEINRVSPSLKVTLKPNKIGRRVASVTISWTGRPLAERRQLRQDMNRRSGGPTHGREGTAPQIADMRRDIPFPAKRSIKHADGGHWARIAQRAGYDGDLTTLGDEIRLQCTRKGKPLNASDIEDYVFFFARQKAQRRFEKRHQGEGRASST